jgi:hypothetical protein
MSDEEIKARFKDASAIITLKTKTLKISDEQSNEIFLKKFKACPKCHARIEKFEGYFKFYYILDSNLF